MPLYDYVCTACGTRVEISHGVHESGPQVCTACGGAMRKALTSPAIVFKGSGWAKKDARDKSSGSSGASDKTSTTEKSGTGEKSGTAEPAKSEPTKSSGGDGVG